MKTKKEIEKNAGIKADKIRLAVKLTMKCKKISAYRINKEAALSRRTVGLFLAGRNSPRLETIIKICDVLGITVEELMEKAGV